MRNLLGRMALALVMAGAGVLVAPGSTAHADPVVRIMLAGDSITQGFDGDFTWRYRLAQELTRQQVPFDFVGPRHEPYGGSNTYLASGWDTDHDAKGGTTLGAQLGTITADMQAYVPDVLVALYGTNDLRLGVTPDQLMTRWRSYVAQARAVRPDVKLVLGEVYSKYSTRRDEANAKLHQLAVELSTDESPVRVADLDSPRMNAAPDSYDGTHPTSTGETLIAQRVAVELQGYGVLPSTPTIARRLVPWTPPVTAVVHRFGRQLDVTWGRAKHRFRARQMRVRWTNVRTGRTVTTPWRRSATHLRTGRLPAGTYHVRLQASRRTMVSLWGPAVVRRVPR